MRKIIDDQRLIYRCCSLYYEENMGQKKIAEYLGISKSSVSRMLELGRSLGIVEIKVHHVSAYMYEDLEEQLRKKYHLRDVIVAESSPLDTKDDRITKLNERAADYLNRLIKDGDYVGVSLGSTLLNITKTTQEFAPKKCTFVPLVGGTSQPGGFAEVQANQVTEALAKKYGGQYISFFSPAVFSNEKLMQEFLKEETVSFVLDYFKKLDIVISGMHVTSQKYGTVEKLGYVSKEQVEKFTEKGAVCNFVGRFVDSNGSEEGFEEFNDRVAGISMEAYKKVYNKILITAGKGNADAILACIKGEYANILIVDVDCARELLSIEG